MRAHSETAPVSTAARWAGRVLSGLAIALLVFEGAIKLAPVAVITETMEQLGWPAGAGMARLLGVLTLACTILYAIPRTAVLGAVLLTGYMGGAIATHLRIGSLIVSHLLFGLYLGLLIWGGLSLRDPRCALCCRSGLEGLPVCAIAHPAGKGSGQAVGP
jgi:hypothetical protein